MAWRVRGKPLDQTVVLALTSTERLRNFSSTQPFVHVNMPGGQVVVRPCIITPKRNKSPEYDFIEATRLSERRALTEANEVFVVGWSIPKTEADQLNLIRQAVKSRAGGPVRLTVVSRHSPREYFERVATVFGVLKGDVQVFNDGFEAFVTERVAAT
jgi:hypothetical protein